MQKIGTLELSVPDLHLPVDERICDLEMVFGGTELNMTATYRRTGKKVEGRFEFDCT